MESEPGAPEFQPTLRLHPMSWLFALAGSVRQLILPLIAVLFFGARGNGGWSGMPMIFTFFLGAMFVRALWHQWVFRYGFGPRGLVILEGLIFRNVRQIEYSRIENVDTERGLLHRLLNVAQVSVQTSTGGKPEALISVLDLDAVAEMRQRVFAEAKPAAAAADAAKASHEPPLLQLSPGELVRFGLIDNRGLILVAAGAGILNEMGFFRWEDTNLDQWMQSSQASELAGLGVAMQVLLAVSVILSALVVVRMLSVVLALVTLFDFTLTRQDGDLRVRYGLLTKIALTLRTRRIQAVHQSQSPLHRLFGRVSLDVDLAGDSGGEPEQQNQGQKKTRWLAPVCPSAAAPALIAAALPVFDPAATPDWQPLAPRAGARIFRRSMLVLSLVAAIPGWWYLRETAVVLFPAVVALAGLHAYLYVKNTRWALERDVLLFRSGWLVRKLTVVPRDRVQSLNLSISPFDRRAHMASLSVDTAGGSARSVGVRIPYLPVGEAQKLAAALYATVSGRT